MLQWSPVFYRGLIIVDNIIFEPGQHLDKYGNEAPVLAACRNDGFIINVRKLLPEKNTMIVRGCFAISFKQLKVKQKINFKSSISFD